MTIVTSQINSTGGIPMSDKIAKHDITEKNEAGQTVVLVPAGQPIPEHLLPKPEAKKVPGPPENKARKGAFGK